MPLFFWFELGSFVVSILCLPYLRRSYLKWFPIFLLVIIIAELMGWYLPRILHKHNAWVFNFSVPFEYLFYCFLYSQAYSIPHFKKFARIVGILYFMFCLIILVLNSITIFQNPILTMGDSLAIVFACLYFYEILSKDEIVNLLIAPMFWVTCGVFLFNLGELTYTLFRPIITKNRWDVTLAVFREINNNLIFWLYGCITIGLLCTRILRYQKVSG
jgi:hypothetical protein